MRFEPESQHGANAGLNIARDLMEGIKQEFPWISYGDLWTLGGVCAIQEMGGPKIPWRPGRIDGFAAQATPDGRLPDGAQGAQHLRNVSGTPFPAHAHRRAVADAPCRRSSTAWASTTRRSSRSLAPMPSDAATATALDMKDRGLSPPLP